MIGFIDLLYIDYTPSLLKLVLFCCLCIRTQIQYRFLYIEIIFDFFYDGDKKCRYQ